MYRDSCFFQSPYAACALDREIYMQQYDAIFKKIDALVDKLPKEYKNNLNYAQALRSYLVNRLDKYGCDDRQVSRATTILTILITIKNDNLSNEIDLTEQAIKDLERTSSKMRELLTNRLTTLTTLQENTSPNTSAMRLSLTAANS